MRNERKTPYRVEIRLRKGKKSTTELIGKISVNNANLGFGVVAHMFSGLKFLGGIKKNSVELERIVVRGLFRMKI